MKPEDCILYSGAASGAEAAFGVAAERHGIDEVNFTFEGHNDARRRGIRVLTHEELAHGDVSLSYVSRLMHRSYPDTPLFKRVLLHQPDWVFLDKATSALDEETEARVYRLLAERLPGATLVTVANRPSVVEYHTRRWSFVPQTDGRVLLEAA